MTTVSEQLPPPQPANETQLIHAVGSWSVRNFDTRRAADFGVLEEIGEATHCVLKRIQGIRGFDNEEFFLKEFGDALADIIIYLCDWCHEHNAFFKFGRNMIGQSQPLTVDDQRRIIRHLVQAADIIIAISDREPEGKFTVVDESQFNMVAQRMCSGVELWAQVYKLDLRLLVANTWLKISQRDWKKNPSGPEAHLK
jgi:hypothetical protein